MALKLLEAFRTSFVGCEIVVLADSSARTVLAWDSAVKWPQEELDALCALAGRVLSLHTAQGAGSAILARPTGSQVIQRAVPDRPELLCSVFAPGAALDGVIEAGQALCARLLEDGPGAGF